MHHAESMKQVAPNRSSLEKLVPSSALRVLIARECRDAVVSEKQDARRDIYRGRRHDLRHKGFKIGISGWGCFYGFRSLL